MGCEVYSYIPRSLVEEWLREDVGFLDLTTSLLGIAGKQAIARLYTRERVVACGLAEAMLVYREAGAESVRATVVEGEWCDEGSLLLEARGPAGSLHAAWRVAQTIAAIGSAVATYTRLLVERARAANPRVVVAVARKAPPGLKHLYYRCVLCGGAILHRAGLSDTILVFPNHKRLIGGLDRVVDTLKKVKERAAERLIVVEVESLDEALKLAAAGVVDEVQFDHKKPEELARAAAELRKVNPNVKIAAAGGITIENVEKYAAIADVIVTSAPYWVKPSDMTTVIEPMRD